MSFNNIFGIASSNLSAETTRLSTTATNMTNANIVAGSPEEVYKPQYPVFQAVQEDANQWIGSQVNRGGVQVTGIYENDAEPVARFEPHNPMANEQGFVYAPSVNYAEEMANMISASRSYQMNVEMLETVKRLITRTIQLGE